MNEEPELLLHFTRFESFVKIWSTKTLRFSPFSRLNDVNDASKLLYNDEHKVLGHEIAEYKQVSLMIPPKNKQYTAMWGHYGDSGQGVCIELNKSKIEAIIKEKQYLHKKVRYVKDIGLITYDGTKPLDKYIKKKQNQLFFVKTADWRYEQEFRIVSRGDDTIDISDAVHCITITDLFGTSLNYDFSKGGFCSDLFKNALKPIINDQVKVWEFCPCGLNGSASPTWRNEGGEAR